MMQHSRRDFLFQQVGSLTKSYETTEPEKLVKALSKTLSSLRSKLNLVYNSYWETTHEGFKVFIDIVWIH